MTSKASARTSSGAAVRPAVLDWVPSPLLVLGLAVAGAVMITFVHDFRMTPSVMFLSIGWFSIVGAGALLWKVGLFIAAGDVGDDGSFDYVSSRVDELNAEKGSLLKAIKEIEFDRMMGKLSDEDAAEITELYRRRAILILRQLDQATPSGDEELTPREQIERDLRARAALARANMGSASRAKAHKAQLKGSLKDKMERVNQIKKKSKKKHKATADAGRAAEEEE